MLNILEEESLENINSNETFKITNIEECSWAFRKLQALARKQSEIRTLATTEMERIAKWEDKETKALDESEIYFEGLISEYLIEQKKLDPKFKITTPYGKANTRKSQPKFTYDDAKVIESLKNLGHTEYIKTVWEVKKAELKKDITIVGQVATDINGEVIEGITVEEQEDRVSISLEG